MGVCVFGGSSPLPPGSELMGSTAVSGSFCQILKEKERKGHFHKWNWGDAAELWTPAREDRCTVRTVACLRACTLAASWSVNTASPQPGIITANRALFILALLGVCLASFPSCVCVTNFQAFKHYWDFKAFYHIIDLICVYIYIYLILGGTFTWLQWATLSFSVQKCHVSYSQCCQNMAIDLEDQWWSVPSVQMSPPLENLLTPGMYNGRPHHWD